MSQQTENEKLAATADAAQDVTKAYDAKHGTYKPRWTQSDQQPTARPQGTNPLSLRSGK